MDKKKRELKQAVLLIHGVGEQVPMDTLRSFVDAVWKTDTSLRRPNVPATVWSKPDAISGDFELRRLTTATNLDRKCTDFFEFYWAHMMEATTFSHIAAWLKVLLLRSPNRVPDQLRPVWWILVLLAIGIAAAAAGYKLGILAPWWGVAGVVLWFLTSGALINIAGDAARYLHVAPPNIKIRREIREAGIELLHKLHTCGEYDRIIVVGHSLGSVIGYDILTHLWPRYHKSHVQFANEGAPTTALATIESMAISSLEGNLDVAEYQAAQARYLTELQNQKNAWLVSDFITLGSPLAHAPVLMARNGEELERKKVEREFPTCPPALEESGREKIKKFSYVSNGVALPHHAAVFGVTRWTNLYFPCRNVIYGDLIGGPIAPVFGPGVRDIPVQTNLRRGIFTHTLYWTLPKATKPDGERLDWIDDLRKALRLAEGGNPQRMDTAPSTPEGAPNITRV